MLDSPSHGGRSPYGPKSHNLTCTDDVPSHMVVAATKSGGVPLDAPDSATSLKCDTPLFAELSAHEEKSGRLRRTNN